MEKAPGPTITIMSASIPWAIGNIADAGNEPLRTNATVRPTDRQATVLVHRPMAIRTASESKHSAGADVLDQRSKEIESRNSTTDVRSRSRPVPGAPAGYRRKRCRCMAHR